MGALRAALKDGNWNAYKKLLADIYALQTGKDRDHCKQVIRYLWNNRQAAHLRYDPDICGSCTESLVSHVLSERLSRTPLAWSERGLKKMVMLVVYCKNGQKVMASDIRASITADEQAQEDLALRGGWSKYNDYMDRQIDLILDADWVNAFQKRVDALRALAVFYRAEYTGLLRFSSVWHRGFQASAGTWPPESAACGAAVRLHGVYLRRVCRDGAAGQPLRAGARRSPEKASHRRMSVDKKNTAQTRGTSGGAFSSIRILQIP